MIMIAPESLALMHGAERAERELEALGCSRARGYDRKWVVPRGQLRAAKKVARSNRYPVVFARAEG